ncbi:MAG: hypothetical protein ACYDEX_17245 [Mobilitalea sp.]
MPYSKLLQKRLLMISTDQYENAVADAIRLEEDNQFAVLYNEIKAQYDITINFAYWDTFVIGSIISMKSN